MKIVYLSEYSDKENHAGSKARNDIEQIFKSNGWKAINTNTLIIKEKNKNIKYFFYSFLVSIGVFLKIFFLKNSIIFCQYPITKGVVLNKILRFVNRRNYLCYIVHDINSIRRSDDKILLQNEISDIKNAITIVVHNNTMKNVLYENGLKVNMVTLQCFDYLADEKEYINRCLAKDIVFAGNLKLGKAGFLSKLISSDFDFNLKLYGPYFDKNYITKKSIEYKGNYAPDIVVDKLEGSFGLVWDGDSVETCSGLSGEYTKYNNPHKLSLYIAAALPVIVWDKAAIADFVKENNIGFAVSSIDEISCKLNHLSEKDYQIYLQNINILKNKVRSAYFTNKAINNTMAYLQNFHKKNRKT